ncbi:MAG: hypothetical protein KF764_33545 [Labilithrix sp.]|nr:hypothetical protein [Labilithrix sp.]
MSTLARHALTLGVLGLFACGPLLGLDDLRARTVHADAGGDGGEDSDAPPGCTANAECIAAADNAPALCVAGSCVAVDQDLCLPQVLPSNDVLARENVVVTASFIPFEVATPLRNRFVYAYDLALTELAEAGGIPGQTRRDVAMILCASEPEIVERSVKHVVQDLQLPAIIANFGAGDMTRFATELTVPGGVLTINPNVTAETLKFQPVEQLVWNLLGTPEDVALAYRPLLARVEGKLRPNGAADGPLKVALLDTTASIESAISTIVRLGPQDRTVEGSGKRLLEKAIAFNGKSAADNGADFKRIPLPAVEQSGSPNYPAIRSTLIDFRPDVVLALTAEEISDVVREVEKGLSDAGASLPHWLLAPRNARAVLDSYINTDAFQARAEKRKRFMGVQYAGAVDDTQRVAWLERMQARFPNVPQAEYAAAENFYDAVYWLAYGLAAAEPGARATGRNISDGVRNLLTGPSIHPGPLDAIANAFRLITAGETTYVGALGPPDIDKRFGTWNSVGGVYCYGVAETQPVSFAPVYDVLRFDRQSGALTEDPDIAGKCFIGF